MKHITAFFLLLGLFFSLTACNGAWIKDESLTVRDHVEQSMPEPAPTEEEQPPVVTGRNELRGAVLSFIRDWTEHGTILVRNYDGDISADLSETVRYATEEEPIGAFAVDYADYELTGTAKEGEISLRIVFRRSAAEVDAIVTVNGNNSAFLKIQQALVNYDTALTLRIRNYEPTDFAAYIRSYCIEHPELVTALPELSAEVYPLEGETRILELHFVYPAERETLRLLQSMVTTTLSSASSYVRTGKDDASRATLLFRFLTERFDYTITQEEPTMPAYSLLCENVAHSLSFASVFYSECLTANLECRIVTGTLDGAARYWNLLCLDGDYYYVDLMRSLELEETELQLLTTKELTEAGYLWDVSAYPATPEPEEQPPEEPANGGDAGNGGDTGNGENGGETELPTTPTESTEPTDEPPTEPPTESSSDETEETMEIP
ncbi:MAG: transglutaminase domain-containing protein [Faecousia sp.]